MTYSIPPHGKLNWDTDNNANLQYVKDTAEAAETPAGAQSKATAAYNAAVSDAATDASNKANAVQANLDTTNSTVNAHTGNTSNPHSVTKAQVGLGNVDNTSDANKPVSTAQQTALDNKVAKGELVLNVKDYGAKGDGTTDDTSAIQSAITAAGTGGRLFFPGGVYLVTSTLTISSNNQEWFGIGHGLNACVLKAGAALASVVRVDAYQPVIHNLSIDAANVATNGIVLRLSAGGDFRLVRVIDAVSHGWKCDINDGTAGGNNNLTKFWHCYGEYNGGDGFAVPAYQSDNNGLSFYDCEFSSNTGNGLRIAGTQSKVHGGEMTGNGGYGILLGNSADAAGTTRDNSLYSPYVEANTGGGIGVAAAGVAGANVLYGEVTQGIDYSLSHGIVHVGWDIGSGGGRFRVLNGANTGLVFDGHNLIVTDPSGNGNLDLYAQGTGAVVSRSPHYLLDKVGFQGATPIAKPTISGSRGGNAALASLLTALASYGLITDSTTA